jgi:hypothetical protein
MAATKSLCALNIGQLSAMTPGSISPAEIDMPLFSDQGQRLGKCPAIALGTFCGILRRKHLRSF